MLEEAVESDKENDLVVVLMERGSHWPACLPDLQRDTPNVLIAAQGDGEASDDFEARAMARIARLVAEGKRVRAAIVSLSHSANTGAGRWLLGSLTSAEQRAVPVFVEAANSSTRPALLV